MYGKELKEGRETLVFVSEMISVLRVYSQSYTVYSSYYTAHNGSKTEFI